MGFSELYALLRRQLEELDKLPEQESRQALVLIGCGLLQYACKVIIASPERKLSSHIISTPAEVEAALKDGEDHAPRLNTLIQCMQAENVSGQPEYHSYLCQASESLVYVLSCEHGQDDAIENILDIASFVQDAIASLAFADYCSLAREKEAKRQIQWVERFSQDFLGTTFDTSWVQSLSPRGRLSPLARKQEDPGLDLD